MASRARFRLGAKPEGLELESLQNWFEAYMAVDGNNLNDTSSGVQTVDSDGLDPSFIEQRIFEATSNARVTKGFCVGCQNLFDNWPTLGSSSTRRHDSKPDPEEKGWEHTTVRPCSTFELESSGRLGCRFCAFLLQNLRDNSLLDVFRKIEARMHRLNKSAKLSLSIQNWGTNPIQILWLNFPGKVCTSCNAGIASKSKINSGFLPASADCYDDPVDVLEIASNWLSNCSDNHELCKGDDDGVLPTRLISIAGESPRLVLTSEDPNRPRYATLSHSWGSHDVIQLTSKRLDSFMKGIPAETLPTTFKDAIKVTRALGLEFLWIDSLCIMQDSEEDWRKESALMCSVYGGSTITIAAASAIDSRQGCFTKQANFSGGLRARITDGGQKRVQDFRNPDVYDLSTSKTHLGTRAWALQEKMLPPRTIHSGDRGTFWECRTTIASEYLPDGFSKHLVSSLVRRKGKFEHLWPQIVRLYSSANLTYGKDKLPALSGISRLGYEETSDQYLAGLWKAQVEEQLCWRRFGSQVNLKRPHWRAPTWSWASVDGGVTWYTPQTRVLETRYAHFLDGHTTTDSQDSFGQVTGGVVRLACSAMVVGHLVSSSQTGAEANALFVLRDGGELIFPIQIDCSDDMNMEDHELVFLLPILGGRTGTAVNFSKDKDPNAYHQELMVQGIVLRATGNTKGEFSRIGCFNFYKNKHNFKSGGLRFEEDTYEPILQVLKEHGSSTAEEACAEVLSTPEHADQPYVVTII